MERTHRKPTIAKSVENLSNRALVQNKSKILFEPVPQINPMGLVSAAAFAA